MSGITGLRSRLVGQRFYDRAQEEAFTVVGITERPALALLQYDDGVAWDEGASNFTVSESVASQATLEKHGLDSERYQPLGPGPRIAQICDADTHEWNPNPEELWPGGVPADVRERMVDHPREIYDRIVRCKRCGLSGDVAGQFGMYGMDGNEYHAPPWFCTRCRESYPDAEFEYIGDFPYCSDCAIELGDESE